MKKLLCLAAALVLFMTITTGIRLEAHDVGPFPIAPIELAHEVGPQPGHLNG